MKKDLPSQIAEGIEKGFWSPLGTILLVLVVLFFVMWITSYYTDPCKEGECSVAAPSCFPLEEVNCQIIIGNSSFERIDSTYDICGFAEAQKKFEFYKLEQGEKLKQYYKDKGNYEIKRLDCK